MHLQMVRDLEAPGKGTHVSMWQDMSNLLMKVIVMAAGVRSLPCAPVLGSPLTSLRVQLSVCAPIYVGFQTLRLLYGATQPRGTTIGPSALQAMHHFAWSRGTKIVGSGCVQAVPSLASPLAGPPAS